MATDSNRENKSEVLQVPVTPKDRQAVEDAADKAGMSTAAWVRKAVRDRLYGN